MSDESLAQAAFMGWMQEVYHSADEDIPGNATGAEAKAIYMSILVSQILLGAVGEEKLMEIATLARGFHKLWIEGEAE